MKIIESLLHINRWIKLLSGSAICLLVFFIVYYTNTYNSVLVKQTIIYFAIPGAYALVGLVEIITGLPFTQISNKWDSLTGWQRAILGLTIVICFFFLIAFTVVAFVAR